jgi:EmrB/QacA subfamily drug resistance transporter
MPPADRAAPIALTLVAVTFGLMLVGLDSTIVSVANPTVGEHFHATLSGLQWVTNAYLLALAVGLVTGGKLGDLFGRKRLFLTGTVGFGLASLACAVSGSLDALIASRVAQGLFGAMMLPQTLAILRATFPLARLAAAVGIWAMSSSIAIASGPLVGGLLVDHVSWRSIFLINLPVGAVSLLVGAWAIRESRDQSENRKLDWPGIALLSAMLFALVWGLIDAEKQGWGHSSHAVAWLLTGGLLLGAFIGWERREQPVRQPHVPLVLFRSRQLSAGLVMVLTTFFALFAVLFYLTLYLERVRGYTAIQTGVRLLALTGVMGLGSLISGFAVGKIGPRVPLLTGALLAAVGLLGLSQLDSHSSYGAIWPFLVLLALGLGPAQTTAARMIVGGAPPNQAGIAGGLHATAVQVGGLLGLSVLGSIITSRVTSVFPHKLIAAGVPGHLASQLKATARAISQGAVPVPRGVSASAADAITGGSLNAFTSGLDTALAISAAVALVGGLGAFLFVRPAPGPGVPRARPIRHPQPASWTARRSSQRRHDPDQRPRASRS